LQIDALQVGLCGASAPGDVTFRRPSGPDRDKLGIDSLTEGHFVGADWVMDRRLNGDQSNQGRFVRLPSETVGLQQVTLYDYS
jgi:Domain of unknown function (DUF5597)